MFLILIFKWIKGSWRIYFKNYRIFRKNKLGKRKTNFRLKDWGVSRQRYWGCPIPIIYDEDGNPHKVPKENLPVELPNIKKLHPSGNPLDQEKEWKYISINGKNFVRETDTLDTFVDSSWYFLRFCSPNNEKYGFDIDKIKYWMPVDQYIGNWTCDIASPIFKIFMRAISFQNPETKINEPFEVFLHKEWFATKPTRIITIIGLAQRNNYFKWGTST